MLVLIGAFLKIQSLNRILKFSVIGVVVQVEKMSFKRDVSWEELEYGVSEVSRRDTGRYLYKEKNAPIVPTERYSILVIISTLQMSQWDKIKFQTILLR